ncbi:MAG: diphthine synthase [Nanoarchaeota archaeon]
MLYLISLGLNDEKDITLRELEIVKKCDLIYLETYTSVLNCSVKDLENLFKKKIIIANRELVENKNDIIENSKKNDVAFLVPGDIFSATTHIDLFLRAKKEKVKVKVLHNASILTAVGETGLMLYNFGKTTSIPFLEGNWLTETPYNVLKDNLKNNLHTLLLLDLRPDKNKFLTINNAIKFLLDLEKKKKENIFTENTFCIGCSALGSDRSKIRVGSAKKLLKTKFKNFPQCLIVPGKLHFMEQEMLDNINTN